MHKGKGAFFFLSALMALAMPHVASAKAWMVDYKNSQLGFSGTESGKAFSGLFRNFAATIDFDPAKPENGKIEVQIDMRSASTGDVQKDSALPSPEWFDSRNIPYAEFTSTEIKPAGDKKFAMKGLFKLKLTTKEIEIPFTLASERDGMRATGSFTINRKDFDVGTGEWASDQFVGYPVRVDINLIAY